MILLTDFFTSAPKKYIAQIFKKQNSIRGVVQGKEVILKTLEWAKDENRLNNNLADLDQSEKLLLLAVYISEKRGLLESDMYSLAHGMNPSKISDTLFKFEDNMLIYCRRGDYYSFHGFADFFSIIVTRLLVESIPVDKKRNSWIGNASHLVSHSINFMAQIQLGRIKCTQKGEFHRRSTSLVIEKMTSGEILSSAVSSLELELNFQFLIDNKFILEDRGTLLLSKTGREFLNTPVKNMHLTLFIVG